MSALPPSIARMIDAAADRYSVSRTLARAVAWVESRGNPFAVSPKGAIGVMQLMPATARGLGVDANDPAQNISGGVRYLAQLIARYGERAGVAAYNWGPGHLAQNPDESRWPAETRNYVANVLQRAEYELATMGARVAANPLPGAPPSPPAPLSSLLPSQRRREGEGDDS